MITKAEILSIDWTTNLCKIRIPIFEGPGNVDPAVFTAVMNVPPGIHSGYAAGDIVLVGFADNSMNKPIVLGKLWLGPAGEALSSQEDLGWVSCKNFEVESTGTASLPSAANITFTTKFQQKATLNDLINRIDDLESEVAQLKLAVATISPTALLKP